MEMTTQNKILFDKMLLDCAKNNFDKGYNKAKEEQTANVDKLKELLFKSHRVDTFLLEEIDKIFSQNQVPKKAGDKK